MKRSQQRNYYNEIDKALSHMKKISLGMIKALTGYAIVLIGVGNLGI